MAVTEAITVAVRLERACAYESCLTMADGLYVQLAAGGYTWPMSVLPLDQDPDEYLTGLRTARRRATRAEALGYRFARFERADYPSDVNEINQSRSVRQGRPMSDAYLRAQTFTPVGLQPCDRHRITQYGVFAPGGALRAYAVVHRSGELGLVSQILGHGDHEPDGIMQLLGVQTYYAEHPNGGYLVYNRHDSGTDGLRQAKEWLRYQPVRIEWQP